MQQITRRLFLRQVVESSVLGVAIAAGLVIPGAVLARWPTEAFRSSVADDGMRALFGDASIQDTDEVNIQSFDLAENGSLVPLTITSEREDIESVSIFAPNNPFPLISTFEFNPGTSLFLGIRIKMAKTGDVVVIAKSADGLLRTRRSIQVTIGGCGNETSPAS